MRIEETDYLVVGAGASGLAFTDALLALTDPACIVADRIAVDW
jgi:cation diffusion facilitator CzcD-associated flavoprotein CzcO